MIPKRRITSRPSPMSHVTGLRKLINLCKRIGACSSTLYVRDPFWADGMRLLYMHGIKVREPMYGFLPSQSLRDLSESSDNQVLVDYTLESGARRRPQCHPMMSRLLRTKSKLYQDFVGREQISKCLRTSCKNSHNEPVAVLYLNFDKNVTVTSRQQADVHDYLKTVVDNRLDRVDVEIGSSGGFTAESVLRLLSPLDTTTRALSERGGLTHQQQVFPRLLDALFEVFKLTDSDDAAAVYLLEKGKDELFLVAGRGDNLKLNRKQSLALGVFGWCALTSRGLLIDNLRNSLFNDIYESIGKPTASILAVPILFGNEVIGVIGLEAKRKAAFVPEQMRFLWYASSLAAVFNRLGTLAITGSVLTAHGASVGEAVRAPHQAQAAELLNELARIAAQILQAARCKIWRAPQRGRPWVLAGICPSVSSDDIKAPREKGWSRFVVQTKKPILLTHIKSPSSYAALIMDKNDYQSSWSQIPSDGVDQQIPLNMQETDNTLSQIAIPCQDGNETIGVAWFYFEQIIDRCSEQQAMWLNFFGPYAGLVIRHLEQGAKDRDAEFVRNVGHEIEQHCRQIAIDVPGIVYAVSKSVAGGGSIGGDFVAVRYQQDMQRAVFVVGDAESHDLAGALRMLPLMTASMSACSESGSPKHILEHIAISVSLFPSIRASALCFVIELDTVRPMLFVSSRGHPPLRIRSGKNITTCPDQSKAEEWWLASKFPLGITLFESQGAGEYPVGEAIRSMQHGDLIIALTDGILEAYNKNDEKFEDTGLLATLGEIKASWSVNEIASHIHKAAENHAEGVLTDDATVVAIRIDTNAMKTYIERKGT